MRALDKRLRALEGDSDFLTVGDLLDSLDGTPLPKGRRLPPSAAAALSGLPYPSEEA